MIKNLTLVAFTLILQLNGGGLAAQENLQAFKIYSNSGVQVSFEEMSKTLSKDDIVLFGEMHNNPIDHWLQLELVKSLSATKELILGAEMFETDDQIVLDEYLEGKIKLDHFKKEAKLWPNYETDYAPLVEFAKENQLMFIATNVPRRYASLVSRQGISSLDSLNPEAQHFLPIIPFSIDTLDKGYVEMRSMMGAHGMGMNIDQMIAAQALKDHTMAENILKNYTKNKLFIHFNGSFHSQYHAGICNYLKQENSGLRVGVIASTESESLAFSSEWKELGDFIIVTHSSMTKTH